MWQALHEASHAARRLAVAGDEDAVVLLPELVLVEAVPDRVFLDEQDVLGLVLLELDDVVLGDEGMLHPPEPMREQIDVVAGVDDRDGADHAAALAAKRCSSSRSASRATSRSSMIRIALVLLVERVLLVSPDGVLGHVERSRMLVVLPLVDQLLARLATRNVCMNFLAIETLKK